MATGVAAEDRLENMAAELRRLGLEVTSPRCAGHSPGEYRLDAPAGLLSSAVPAGPGRDTASWAWVVTGPGPAGAGASSC